MEVIQNYIDGEWVDSESGQTLDVVNPATAKAIAQVPLSTAGEVDQAVQA